MKQIKINHIIQFILWCVAYIPIIALSVLKNKQGTLMPWCEISIFVLLVIICYFIFAKIYLYFSLKRKKNQVKKGRIIDKEFIAINEYSYFIITLFMPLLFEDINSSLDFSALGVLMFLVIYMFTRKDYIIINPIFLLSGYKIMKVKFINVDNPQKGYAIIKKDLDLLYDLNYLEVFPNVYYFFEEYRTKKS